MEYPCVVCTCPADVYCHNDRALLCHACDAHVHSAHALAGSHHRTPVCAVNAPEDVATDGVDAGVPHDDFLPFSAKLDKDCLGGVDDLSFSGDDAWFAVPDTACSNANSHSCSKPVKVKSFEYDDLFELDAALEDDMALALDQVSSDILADSLVPDCDIGQQAEGCLPVEERKAEIQALPNRNSEGAVPDCSPLSPFPMPTHPPHSAPPSTPAYSCYVQPPMPDALANVDGYIPHSLLPMDAAMRAHALADRRSKVQRFREKKKNRQFKKLIRYASRKRYAEVRPRIKGRFARKDEIEAAKAAGVPLTC